VILLAQLLLYLVALAGVLLGALGALFFAGGALNSARPPAFRWKRGVLALLCVCVIVASTALGFVGIATIMYFARQQ
jgi:hypothetical protein